MGNDELKRSFGARVQALREACGLTQEQLAERIERSVDTVSNIERGANSTRIETAGRIAQALGVTLPELFEFETPGPGRDRRRMINGITRQLANQDDQTFDLICELVATGFRLTDR